MPTTNVHHRTEEVIESDDHLNENEIEVPVLPDEFLVRLIDRIDGWLREEHSCDPAKYRSLFEALKQMVAEVSETEPERVVRVLEKISGDLENFHRSRAAVERKLEQSRQDIEQGKALGPFGNAEDAMRALREATHP